MKKSLFVALLSLVVISASAQTARTVGSDPLTGEPVRETTKEKLYDDNAYDIGLINAFEIAVRRIGDHYVMPATIWLRKEVSFSDLSNVALLLENGDLFELQTLYQGGTGWAMARGHYFDTCFDIPNYLVEKLRTLNVTDMRVNYVGGFYDSEIAPEHQSAIRRMINALDTPAFVIKPSLYNTLTHDDTDFLHLDLGLNLGTTGIGLEVAAPVTDYFQLRAGFSFVPSVRFPMTYTVPLGNLDKPGVDEEGNPTPSTYEKATTLFHDLTGSTISNTAKMDVTGKFFNANLLVDAFPLADRAFHVTLGFYLGNGTIAHAVNASEMAPTLVALGMCNQLFSNVINEEPLVSVGDFAIWLGRDQEDRIWDYATNKTLQYVESLDGLSFEEQQALLLYYGKISAHLGERLADGKPYFLLPAEDGTVSMDVKVNRFKPYLGVGYGGKLIKNCDDYRWSVDAGMMFWGGAPRVIMHDGTDLIRDVACTGRIGDYCSMVRKFPVFPVLNFTISKRIF